MTASRAALVIALALGLAACASTPPRQAQKKSVEAGGKRFEVDGEYLERNTALTIRVNGDPVMSGTFPPYTPTMKLHARYQGVDFTADCYFASVLGNRGGRVGWISGIVQNNVGKAGDKCEVLAGGKAVETLYF
jgi:hypothetical protein